MMRGSPVWRASVTLRDVAVDVVPASWWSLLVVGRRTTPAAPPRLTTSQRAGE